MIVSVFLSYTVHCKGEIFIMWYAVTHVFATESKACSGPREFITHTHVLTLGQTADSAAVCRRKYLPRGREG